MVFDFLSFDIWLWDHPRINMKFNSRWPYERGIIIACCRSILDVLWDGGLLPYRGQSCGSCTGKCRYLYLDVNAHHISGVYTHLKRHFVLSPWIYSIFSNSSMVFCCLHLLSASCPESLRIYFLHMDHFDSLSGTFGKQWVYLSMPIWAIHICCPLRNLREYKSNASVGDFSIPEVYSREFLLQWLQYFQNLGIPFFFNYFRETTDINCETLYYA